VYYIYNPHPSTTWSQGSDIVLLVIEVSDPKDISVYLEPDGHLMFSAKGTDDMLYELDLDLYNAANQKVDLIVDRICLLGVVLYYMLIILIFPFVREQVGN
jgi:hypothetical protein